MKLTLFFLLTLILPSLSFGQAAETVAVVEVDLHKKCQEELKKNSSQTEISTEECDPSVSPTIDKLAMDIGDIIRPEHSELLEGCHHLADFKDLQMEPIKVELPGEEKPKKNIIVRFTTGLKTVPHDIKTKMNFHAADGTVTSKDFVMKYDTRWKHLNPKNWKSLEDATNFLHESTWGYQVDVLFEGKTKKRTGLTLFFDHPKFKGAMAETDTPTGKNLRKVATIENRNFGDTSAYEQGDKVYHIQNSHMNIIGGLKVSREVWVKEFKNGGRMSYGVHAGLGANMGISRVVEAKVDSEENGGYWKSQVGKAKVQGMTAMGGHSLEYEKGKTSVALTHSVQYSKITQDYLDGGKVKYSLPHTALALTVSVNVFDQQKREARRKKKGKK